MGIDPFPVQSAASIAASAPETRWLVDQLWGYDAVGILGGEPKCCKSLCALTIAVAVAAGRTCLGGYQARRTGPVLVFAAEDAPAMVRDRLSLITMGMGIDLAAIPIQIMTMPALRLDSDHDRQRLALTVAVHRPVLLVLDPFVRLHRVDENVAGEVAPILDGLRQLQRVHGCAILVVHHARKGASHVRAGQALRGSSEFHAWGDSNLFLRRQDDALILDIEHRAAPSPDPIRLHLEADERQLVLRGGDAGEARERGDPEHRLHHLLSTADGPLSRRQIQAGIRVRSATVGALLERWCAAGRLTHDTQGYRLAATTALAPPAALQASVVPIPAEVG